MAKFTAHQKLTQEQRQKVLLELCQAFVAVKSFEEVANFLGDLFSDQEIQMIAKRLQIAKLLLRDKTYGEIQEELKVSEHTIARVNLWLQQSGAGYRMVIARGKDVKIPAWKPPATAGQMSDSWAHIKRRYPLYFWPQLLLEEIVRTSNNRQRKKLLNTLSILRKSGRHKKEVFRYLGSLLQESKIARPSSIRVLEKELELPQKK